MATLALRAKLASTAVADPKSPLFGLDADALDADDGALFAGGDASRRDRYGDIVSRTGAAELSAEATSEEQAERKARSTYAFGATFAEVGVDDELGVVRVRRLVGAYGVGRVLNAKTARSQLMGGLVWAIGFALEEQTVRDERSARAVTRDLADYHLPVNADVPPIEIATVVDDDPFVNAIGAKGIGEIGITGATAAIANAVFHATGKRVRDLPITLDKLA